jgi:hypothetical protein
MTKHITTTQMATPDDSDQLVSHLGFSSGVVIWCCHLVLSPGVVTWCCHQVLSSGVVT